MTEVPLSARARPGPGQGGGRYASHTPIEWWDQERVREARVMVVGAGAIGNEVLKNLALVGVGHILLIDSDRIEMANLSRSVLYRSDDLGRPKVDVARERLSELNPGVQVATVFGDVSTDLGLGAFRRVDLVLGCLDNRAARLTVNRACLRTETPWIDGALEILMGLVRTYVPPIGACYECTLTELDKAEIYQRFSCSLGAPATGDIARVPTVATSSSLIAAIQVQEALKWIHGIHVPTGVGLYYDGHVNSLSRTAYTRRDDCPAHAPFGEPIALDVRARETTLGSLMEQAGALAGGDPVVVIPDHDLVRAFVCPGCGKGERVDRPLIQVVPSGIACPSCGANRIPQIVARLGKESRASTVSLSQLGIPPLAVLQCEVGGQRRFVELAGDEPEVLSAWDIQCRRPRRAGVPQGRPNASIPNESPL